MITFISAVAGLRHGVVCPDGKNENKLFFYFFVFPAACIIFVCDLIIQKHAI